MRLSDLRDKPIRDLDGKALGRVHEVHCNGGKVVALMCGAGSLIERMTSRGGGRRIAWERVRRVGPDGIVIAPEQSKKTPSSAARSRQGTRRPSARRSKR